MSADLGALFASALDGGFGGELRKAAGPVALLDRPGLLDDDFDEDDPEWITELEKFSPTRVDGVSSPANGVPVLLMKSTGAHGGRAGVRVRARMVKSQPERRFSLHVAYPVGKLDVSTAQDGHRDFAGADAVEQGAWEFMKSGQQIGLFHRDGSGGAGTCVESSIYRGPQYSMTAADGSTQTIVPGDWLIGIQWSPEAWKLVKSGVINGVSMQGTALRRKPSPEALAGLRKGKAAKKQAKRERRLAKAAELAQALRKAQVAEQVRMVARAVVAEHFADLYARSSALRERIEFMEQQREQRARAAYGL